MVTLIAKYFPLFAVLYNLIPALLYTKRFESVNNSNGEVDNKIKLAYWGSAIYMLVFWTPMLIGIFIGNVPTMLHFFIRRIDNPYIISYWITVAIISIVGFIWVMFFNGAQFINDYYLPLQASRKSQRKSKSVSPGMIKLIASIGPIIILLIWLFVLPDDAGYINNLLSEVP